MGERQGEQYGNHSHAEGKDVDPEHAWVGNQISFAIPTGTPETQAIFRAR